MSTGQRYDRMRPAATDIHPGPDIKRRREALGLSREWLAYRASVSVRTVERIEDEKTAPRRATLAMIEAALSEPEPSGKAA